jgi:hypothetical protein
VWFSTIKAFLPISISEEQSCSTKECRLALVVCWRHFVGLQNVVPITKASSKISFLIWKFAYSCLLTFNCTYFIYNIQAECRCWNLLPVFLKVFLNTVHFRSYLIGSMPYNNISLHCRAGYLYVILQVCAVYSAERFLGCSHLGLSRQLTTPCPSINSWKNNKFRCYINVHVYFEVWNYLGNCRICFFFCFCFYTVEVRAWIL